VSVQHCSVPSCRQSPPAGTLADIRGQHFLFCAACLPVFEAGGYVRVATDGVGQGRLM
jgi:hypothetical protein